MVEAVLFDLDETLLDRASSVKAFVTQQFSGEFGTFENAEALANRFTVLDDRNNGHKASVYRQIFAEMGLDCPDIWCGFLQDFESNSWRYARSHDAMRSTLWSLGNAGMRLGLITNGETHLQLRSILALDLDLLVDTYLISESECLRKPDAEIFLRAAERLHVAPRNCAFVGDTPQTDMIGARQVGMRTIWFPNGMNWPEDYDWRPDAEIAHLSELPTVLRGLHTRSFAAPHPAPAVRPPESRQTPKDEASL
ncbi:MAG: HAD family hydrolase [Marinibacterium sp.]|nr:HAD family hydrolase [Marinibacterium sp.]